MINVKKWLLPFVFATSGVAQGQGTAAGAHYPQMYENQQTLIKEPEKVLSPQEQLSLNITKLASDPVLKNAHWGFVIYDPKTRRILNSYNETQSFVPASTTKLLTTETALSLLGPRFRWLTQLEYSGEIDQNGVLNGNLYIVGSGDPSLGTRKGGAASYSEIIADFASALSAKGIKKIAGNIVLQTAVFKENKMQALPANIVWLEHGSYYLPVGATTDIDPRSERVTARQTSPFQDARRYFYVSPYSRQMAFSDKFDGTTLTTKLPDSPSYLGNTLKTTLTKQGLPVTGTVVVKMLDPTPEKRVFLTAYRSPALKDIVYATNQPSDNALAESLLRMVGFQKEGDQTLERGRAVVTEHLRSINFDMNGLNYMDGSGLSKSNFVTPIAQAKFLANLMSSPYYRDFQESLPVAGQTGTLKKMFFGNSYGQIFAKTGTLNKVKTLAGYVKTKSGKTLTFSLLVNNYAGSTDQVKAKMEALLDPVIDF